MHTKNIFGLAVTCLIIVCCCVFIAEAEEGGSLWPEKIEELSLYQAISFALQNNPEILIAQKDIEAAEARKIQASQIPNPELEFELENFYGDGDLQDFNSSEATVSIGQLIRLAGKRRKSKYLSEVNKGVSESEYEIKRLDVLISTQSAFVDVLSFQKKLEFQNKLLDITKALSKMVSERVEAGKVSQLERSKSIIELSSQEISLERTRIFFNSSKISLSRILGSNSDFFQNVTGDLEKINDFPSVDDLLAQAGNNLDLLKFEQEIEAKEAELQIEKAKRIPDIKIAGGLKYFNETDEQAFVLSGTIELPLFNLNKGSILEASNNIERVKIEKDAFTLLLRAQLKEKSMELASLLKQIRLFKEKIIPLSESTFNDVKTLYKEGKTDYLNVLDSERTHFENNINFIEVLTEYHKSYLELSRLIGTAQFAD